MLQIALAKSPPTHVVASFIDAYEDSLAHSDQDGNTVAHACVDNMPDCYGALNIMLQHQDDLGSRCNNEGKLPLHLHMRDAEGTKLLLQRHPSGIKQRDVRGRTPLHCALSGDEIHVGVVRVLLDALEGNIKMRDKSGITPIFLLCKKLDSSLEENREDEATQELWQLFLDMIRNESSPELHTILCLEGCPTSMIRKALQQFPSQACERDVLGRTPLHIAVTYCQAEVISLLANFYPPAARMTDSEGRLPIDLAAEYGKDSEVVSALIRAEPRAVDTRDLRDKRYPFLAAALSERSTVSTTYDLLRAKPHVISYFNLN
jgi:ankyrin repeat protein